MTENAKSHRKSVQIENMESSDPPPKKKRT